MKLISRKQYLEKLMDVKGSPDIKVITGIRRSGKSKLLESYIKLLLQKEPEANIIHINYNFFEFQNLNNTDALVSYVMSKYNERVNNYLFIDEVQLCKNFEIAINSFHAHEIFDIYITGSNAFLLSSDLATLFTGRTFEIEVFPFSFKEFIQYYEFTNIYEAYLKYLFEGGMSGSYIYTKSEEKNSYIKNVFETLIVRDIKQKYKIRNEAILVKIINFLIDNVSNLTSLQNITEILNKNSIKVDYKTVAKHVDYLCKAFAFYKVSRFDIKGKKYLASTEKYYLCDHSFKYSIQGSKNQDYGRLLENIVAIDLLRRGYEIYVGVLYKKEIDFVVLKHNEKFYIQVANSIEDEETKKREIEPLLKIPDAYPKIIITRTGYPEYDIEGVKIIDISDWLMRE